MAQATALVVLRTTPTTSHSVTSSGWSTVMPAAMAVKAAMRASSRWNASTRSVASVTMSTMSTTRPGPAGTGGERHVPVRRQAGDADAVRRLVDHPARERVLEQREDGLLVTGDELEDVLARARVVGARAEVVLVEAGPRLVAPLEPHVDAEDRHSHRYPVEEQLEQLGVKAGLADRDGPR